MIGGPEGAPTMEAAATRRAVTRLTPPVHAQIERQRSGTARLIEYEHRQGAGRTWLIRPAQGRDLLTTIWRLT
jgi:hypothetical protein